LNGLEISEISFREVLSFDETGRIDSGFFTKEQIGLRKTVAEWPTLGNSCNNIVCGPFGSTILDSNYVETGVPMIRPFNLRKMRSDAGDIVFLQEKFVTQQSLKVFRRGDLMFARVGDVGCSLLVQDQATISPNIIAASIDPESLNPYFAAIFFNTPYGSLQMEGAMKVVAQPTISTALIRNLRIPALSGIFQKRMEQLFLKSEILLLSARDAQTKAEQILLERTGLNFPLQEDKNASVKSFSESFAASGRLDAEFYQPKFDELFKHIHENADYVKTVGEMETFNARGLQPVYAEHGTLAIINSRHILEDGLDYDGFERTESACWDTQERAQVCRNDILVYTTGANIGRSQPYLSDEPALASNHVNILRIQGEEPLYVAFVMNTLIGRMQTDRLSAGTAQAELYPKDISQFLIPFVPKKKQQEIIARLIEAREKKAESYRLLEKAKQAVEIAIEQGEEAATAYLEGRNFVAQTITQDLAQKAPYFSIDAVRRWLAEQKMSYAPDTVKSYLSRQNKEGKIFDSGRGWYSSIAKPYQLDTAPVEKLVGELKAAFPLLDFACWSTEQLNEMLRHQLAKHVQFAYVERDAIDSVADWLKSHGYKTYANPGKQERKRFSIEEKTVVVLPLTTKTPHQDGFASVAKIVVDVLADTGPFSIINIPEFIDGASDVIKSQRIDMSELMKYSTRRKTDISSLINSLVIH
jgi:restriction endonuclease S subunit